MSPSPNHQMNTPRSRHLTPIIALFVWFFIWQTHARSPVVNSTDSVWSLYTARSLIEEGNLNLDEYKDEIKRLDKFGVRIKRKHYYNYFPYTTSLFAVPLVYFADRAPMLAGYVLPGCGVLRKYEEAKTTLPPSLFARLPLERAAASFVVACIGVVLLFIALEKLSLPWALAVVFSLSFGTSLWSVASRGLWQHGPGILLTSASILLLLKAEKNSWLAGFAGATAAIAYTIRPTNSLSLLFFGLYVAWRHPQALVRFAVYAGIVLTVFVLVNIECFAALLPPYFLPKHIGATALFSAAHWQAIAANLVSPSRGLLVMSPFFIFGFAWLVRDILRKKASSLEVCCFAVIVAHLLLVSTFDVWWAGHSFGPRFMSDVLGHAGLVLICGLGRRVEKLSWITGVGLALTILCAIYFHSRGARNFETQRWTIHPNNIDQNPQRIWNWRDAQWKN